MAKKQKSVYEMKRHPLSALWGDMAKAEQRELHRSVESEGVLNNLVIYEDMLLDGWHRCQAAQAAGVPAWEVPKETFDGTHAEAAEFVIAQNAYRRSYKPGQRAAIIVTVHDWASTGRTGAAGGKTSKDMAHEANTSERTIRDAKVAEKGGLGKQVREGELSPNTAAKIAKAGKADEYKAARSDKAKADIADKAKPRMTAKEQKRVEKDLQGYMDSYIELDHEVTQFVKAVAKHTKQECADLAGVLSVVKHLFNQGCTAGKMEEFNSQAQTIKTLNGNLAIKSQEYNDMVKQVKTAKRQVGAIQRKLDASEKARDAMMRKAK